MVSLILASNFVYLTAIQVLSNHKKECGGRLGAFFMKIARNARIGLFCGEMAAKTHF